VLRICAFRVTSFDINHKNLSWEIENTTEDALLYSFYVERSEAQYGPWTLVGGHLKDKYRFRDTTIIDKQRNRKTYYRLRVVADNTQETTYTEPVGHEPERDLIADEIVRRMDLLFVEFVGRESILFPARTFGTRCPDCWDSIRSKVTKDRCPTCYSRGFAGGFHSPTLIYVQIDPEAEAVQPTSAGASKNTVTTARTTGSVIIKPQDVIVEAENKRWLVMSVSGTKKLRAVVHQELTLTKIVPGDIEYKLPVNINEYEFEPSPGREFTNPQNLESIGPKEIDLEDVLRAYGFPDAH
jgi:hypothetical protein